MISRRPVLAGILLILIGFAMLLKPHFTLDFYLFRSYGLFLLGILGLLKGLNASPRRSIYLPVFILALGAYYILGDAGFYYTDRGLTVSVIILLLGVSFYPLYFLVSRKWSYLLYGNLMMAVGLLFLAYYLDYIPPYIFRTVVEDYWPVALIIIGVAYLINSLTRHKDYPVSRTSNQSRAM